MPTIPIAANTAGSTQTNTPRLTVTTGLTPGTLDDGQTRKIATFTIFCKGSRQRRRGMGCSRTTQSTCELWLFSNSSNNIVAQKKQKSRHPEMENSVFCVSQFWILILFQRKDMGSEESVGSVELKKILESFEAGEVLPEVKNMFRLLWTWYLTWIDRVYRWVLAYSKFDWNGHLKDR